MEQERTNAINRKYAALDEQIREAQERAGRGEAGAEEHVAELRGQRAGRNSELQTATNNDYLIDRKRRRAIRSKLEKVIDALRGEM